MTTPDNPVLTEQQIARFTQVVWVRATSKDIDDLHNLGDDELICLANSHDMVAAVESNRRLIAELQREAERTNKLTDAIRTEAEKTSNLTTGIFWLTGALVFLTVVMAADVAYKWKATEPSGKTVEAINHLEDQIKSTGDEMKKAVSDLSTRTASHDTISRHNQNMSTKRN